MEVEEIFPGLPVNIGGWMDLHELMMSFASQSRIGDELIVRNNVARLRAHVQSQEFRNFLSGYESYNQSEPSRSMIRAAWFRAQDQWRHLAEILVPAAREAGLECGFTHLQHAGEFITKYSEYPKTDPWRDTQEWLRAARGLSCSASRNHIDVDEFMRGYFRVLSHHRAHGDFGISLERIGATTSRGGDRREQ